ncbi:uncharacterized protein LOC142223218 [Haematobia irritans]|uniref:uncharacterized protein LOC142223218 n=1 Tax=Haematobia irritans TaxID=7368 RepID=UPI003F4F51B7
MAKKLEDVGFKGAWTDVRTKLDNLTRKYRSEKGKIGSTGGEPSNWQHHHKLHNILGSFKIHNVAENMFESTNETTTESVLDFDARPSCSNLSYSDTDCLQNPLKKRKKANINEELFLVAKERNTLLKERGQQTTEILKRIDENTQQNAKFQMELLEILRKKN